MKFVQISPKIFLLFSFLVLFLAPTKISLAGAPPGLVTMSVETIWSGFDVAGKPLHLLTGKDNQNRNAPITVELREPTSPASLDLFRNCLQMVRSAGSYELMVIGSSGETFQDKGFNTFASTGVSQCKLIKASFFRR